MLVPPSSRMSSPRARAARFRVHERRRTPRHPLRRQHGLSAEYRRGDVVRIAHLAEDAFRRAVSHPFRHRRIWSAARSDEPCKAARYRPGRCLRRRRAALSARGTCRRADQSRRRDAHQAARSASYGVPIVATRFGAEGSGFRSGRELLLADNERDFATSCARLLTDGELASLLVAGARRTVYRDYNAAAMGRAPCSTRLMPRCDGSAR